jgi:hypothetical protein
MSETETLTFREAAFTPDDETIDYNEIQQSLSVTQSTENMRNGVSMQGVVPVGDTSNYFNTYQQVLVVYRDDKWPNNVDAPNYSPWMRWVIKRDPMQADAKRLELSAKELYKRVSRNMRLVSFSTWGNPKVYPYQLIRIIERSGETGVGGTEPENGALYLVTSVQHNLDTNSYLYTTQIDAELLEQGSYTFGHLDRGK